MTKEETDGILDDRDFYEEEGFQSIEITTYELSGLGTGTHCGKHDNSCFVAIAEKYPDRLVRGWYDEDENWISGMVHIQCTEDESEDIGDIAEKNGGSLRPECDSDWDGFYEFEIE